MKIRYSVDDLKRSISGFAGKPSIILFLLRVGPGQHSQILFISVEQLSLKVADDSDKTLSVLGNIGDFLDDCLLRFVQMCRRPPSKIPPNFGVQRIFSKYYRKRTPTEIIPNR